MIKFDTSTRKLKNNYNDKSIEFNRDVYIVNEQKRKMAKIS